MEPRWRAGDQITAAGEAPLSFEGGEKLRAEPTGIAVELVHPERMSGEQPDVTGSLGGEPQSQLHSRDSSADHDGGLPGLRRGVGGTRLEDMANSSAGRPAASAPTRASADARSSRRRGSPGAPPVSRDRSPPGSRGGSRSRIRPAPPRAFCRVRESRSGGGCGPGTAPVPDGHREERRRLPSFPARSGRSGPARTGPRRGVERRASGGRSFRSCGCTRPSGSKVRSADPGPDAVRSGRGARGKHQRQMRSVSSPADDQAVQHRGSLRRTEYGRGSALAKPRPSLAV